jgi:hypothetical protein
MSKRIPSLSVGFVRTLVFVRLTRPTCLYGSSKNSTPSIGPARSERVVGRVQSCSVSQATAYRDPPATNSSSIREVTSLTRQIFPSTLCHGCSSRSINLTQSYCIGDGWERPCTRHCSSCKHTVLTVLALRTVKASPSQQNLRKPCSSFLSRRRSTQAIRTGSTSGLVRRLNTSFCACGWADRSH